MIQSLICMLGTWFAIPLTCISCLCTSNFWLSMALSSATIFISGSYFSPSITMMQNSVKRSQYGNVVSAYCFITNLIQPLVPAIFGIMAKYFNAFKFPTVYGKLISLFITVGYGLSGYFYWRAGRAYAKMMRSKQTEQITGLQSTDT